jgi:hypothetical protein
VTFVTRLLDGDRFQQLPGSYSAVTGSSSSISAAWPK